jgi:DNA-binding Lrp family transcriptional regulator
MTEREEIKVLMNEGCITYAALAKKCGMREKQLHYRLNTAAGDDIPLGMYTEIMNALKSFGVDVNSAVTCSSLVDVTLKANVEINRDLSELNDEIRLITEDGVIEPKEKARLKKQLATIRKHYNDKFDELESLLK